MDNSLRVRVKNLLAVFLVIIIISSCTKGPDLERLKYNMPWEERTLEKKLISRWCSEDTFSQTKARRASTRSLVFHDVIYFYNDNTMAKYYESNSPFDSGDPVEEGENLRIIDNEIHYISNKYGERVIPYRIVNQNEISLGIYKKPVVFKRCH